VGRITCLPDRNAVMHKPAGGLRLFPSEGACAGLALSAVENDRWKESMLDGVNDARPFRIDTHAHQPLTRSGWGPAAVADGPGAAQGGGYSDDRCAYRGYVSILE